MIDFYIRRLNESKMVGIEECRTYCNDSFLYSKIVGIEECRNYYNDRFIMIDSYIRRLSNCSFFFMCKDCK
jgi:hypothetical protein